MRCYVAIGGRNCKLCCVCDESMGQQILLQATMAAAARWIEEIIRCRFANLLLLWRGEEKKKKVHVWNTLSIKEVQAQKEATSILASLLLEPLFVFSLKL